MIDCIITYQKSNGDIFCRGTKHDYSKRIGDETSMGWTVLDIHYLYEGNYYQYADFTRIIHGRTLKQKKKKRFIRFLINQLNKLI